MLYIGQLRCHFSKWVVTTNITFSEKNKKHRIWPLEPELFKKQTLKTFRQREVSHFQQNMSRCRPKFACFWSQFSRLENWVRLFLPVLSYQQRLNNVLNVSWQPKCTCLFENVASPVCGYKTRLSAAKVHWCLLCVLSVWNKTPTLTQHLTSLTESRRHGNFVLLSFWGAFQLCEKQKKSGLQTKSLYGSLNSLPVEDWSVTFVLCSLTSLPERNFEVTTFWSVNVKNVCVCSKCTFC